jgi:membrane-associated HD superfamily phosphohydrolase
LGVCVLATVSHRGVEELGGVGQSPLDKRCHSGDDHRDDHPQRVHTFGHHSLVAIIVGFALGLIVTVFGLGRGILRTEPRRLVLYAVMIGGLLVTLLVKSSPYSLSSFLMLAVLCLPFIAMFRVRVAEYRQGPNDLQRLMALLAVAGLLQMAVQFVAKPEWMFPLDMFLPEQLSISQFNLRIPITDSLPYLKGNGLVFLEPSHFSQFPCILDLNRACLFSKTYSARSLVPSGGSVN